MKEFEWLDFEKPKNFDFYYPNYNLVAILKKMHHK